MNVKTRDAGLVQDAGSREKKLSQGIKNINWTGIAFVAPSVIVVVALLFYPLGSSVHYSMTNKNLIKAHYELVGLDNFTQLLTDPTFWQAFVTSIKWTALSIVGQLALGFILAMALNRIRRFSALFRTLLIIPWAFPAVIIGFGWKWILNDVYGVVPNALADMGLTDGLVALLADPKAAFWMVLYINVWFGTPLFMVNILSALKTVPGDQIEAATVDGASAWKRFYYITLPHIRAVIGLLVVLRTIWVFNNFDLLFLITGGGPGDVTTTLPIFAYRTGWGLKQLGMASAVTILLLVFLILVASILFRFITRWEKETS
ncbi:carbohydrate ABC transporter permease [Mobiluncus mulieris]|uniref:Sugar ABC transporter permease n=1 Tax=Mobiluncus mulieris TaxID=2052 RepID=A0A7Y0TYA8_9ACTO|nr:sugar ABC transporter permease [Mobiluncus mulieris]MCU9974878.1 sugar ABC transporter permease [Mobiluncus mulieris]NMW61330.1 sugar ABC transporter permease [Mobiluncus mulieris]NMX03603.1 sugar ABC transporter permease [Mobiluncus mulieris]NMX10473.1 sugar ABC transporter permease [Mobiluncus mulieris]PNL42604.1 sugar ABC transporter permease [Mobiluncus mulieris]